MAFVIINTTGLVQTTGIGSFIISAMRILTQSHRIFVGLVISQILLMAFYFIWSNILIYYQFLGSDKVVLSLSISLSVFCALHIVINLGLLECLPKIFKLANRWNHFAKNFVIGMPVSSRLPNFTMKLDAIVIQRI
ncbi:hypothetical protein BC833DRAFT_570305 [Globomyces pollinis-pini]|nr:hypothetical protein BC833DRAFT_570305 [Globomyces pollinis-pini]